MYTKWSSLTSEHSGLIFNIETFWQGDGSNKWDLFRDFIRLAHSNVVLSLIRQQPRLSYLFLIYSSLFIQTFHVI